MCWEGVRTRLLHLYKSEQGEGHQEHLNERYANVKFYLQENH